MDEKIFDEVQELATTGLRLSLSRLEAEHFFERSLAATDYWRLQGVILDNQVKTVNTRLKALGFHDVGHARGEVLKHKTALAAATKL